MMTIKNIKLTVTKDEKQEFDKLTLLLDLLKIDNDIQDGFLTITYEDLEVYHKLHRSNGRKRKDLNSILTITEVQRMIDKKTAEHVANRLGISRRTLFRRLKQAEESGSKYLY